MNSKHITHCLWIDPDSGLSIVDEVDSQAEKIPHGDHVPARFGTEKEMNRLSNRLQRRPYLIEKFITK